MVDKNKPSSWRPFKISMCKLCVATCCTMPLEVKIEDLVTLGLVENIDPLSASKRDLQRIAKELQRAGLVKSYRESTGLFLMQEKPNGDCRFLNENRLCTVYAKRPNVCRQFPEKMGLRLGYCPFLKK